MLILTSSSSVICCHNPSVSFIIALSPHSNARCISWNYLRVISFCIECLTVPMPAKQENFFFWFVAPLGFLSEIYSHANIAFLNFFHFVQPCWVYHLGQVRPYLAYRMKTNFDLCSWTSLSLCFSTVMSSWHACLCALIIEPYAGYWLMYTECSLVRSDQ